MIILPHISQEENETSIVIGITKEDIVKRRFLIS